MTREIGNVCQLELILYVKFKETFIFILLYIHTQGFT